ncbi:hypothetical protein [Streptomyces niger]|uniref:hypothetical protein n=1 Tax=Streptomyces niger TaxID=66373 RepID=UPI00389ACF39
MLLHGAEHLVRNGIEGDDHHASDRSHCLAVSMAACTSNGIIGRSSPASADKGKPLLGSSSDSARDHLSVITGGCARDRGRQPEEGASLPCAAVGKLPVSPWRRRCGTAVSRRFSPQAAGFIQQ